MGQFNLAVATFGTGNARRAECRRTTSRAPPAIAFSAAQ
jgi:hypothetical protein